MTARSRNVLLMVSVGLLALAQVVMAGCSRAETREPGPLRVVVTVPPIKGILQPVLPADAEITVLVRPGTSPHGLELTPSDLSAIARADLVVAVGAGLDSRVITTARHGADFAELVVWSDVVGIEGVDHGHDHAHEGDDHGHDHGSVDPHLWLDIGFASSLIAHLTKWMDSENWITRDPQAGLAELRRYAGLMVELEKTLEPVRGVAFVTHHDSLSRMAERFSFVVVANVRPLESVDPTPGELAAAAEAIQEQGAVAILTEPQLPRAPAERLAEMTGVPLGTIDVLGDGQYAETLRAIAAELVRVTAEAAAADEP